MFWSLRAVCIAVALCAVLIALVLKVDVRLWPRAVKSYLLLDRNEEVIAF